MGRTFLRARLALLAVCVAALGLIAPAHAAPTLHPRIVGGTPGTIAEHPWQVILLVGDASLCSGSLIASTWVLTAAHCMDGVGPDRVQVWPGLNSLSQRTDDNALSATEVIVHPEWNATSYANDLALIRLAKPWEPGPERQAISLPTTVDAANWPVAGAAATISGWGVQAFGGESPDQIQQATAHVIASPGAPCGEYGSQFNPAVQLCAGELNGSIDTCQGDSGGPLVVVEAGLPLLAGVTSIGNDCALANYPGLYTRVSSFIPWIRQYADIPVSAPLPPTAIAGRPLAGGRIEVSWSPSAATGGADITSYTATAAPGGATCTALATTCTIAGLTPGTAYTFTVAASNAAGASAASVPSVPVTAVSGTVRKGGSVRKATLAKWAGAPAANATLTVLTKKTCAVTASGVRATKVGLCKVRVKSSGATGIANIAVR